MVITANNKWMPTNKPNYHKGEPVSFPGMHTQSTLLAGHSVCFDFDGVIHAYTQGWQDGSIYDSVNENAMMLMGALTANGIPCFICSTRDPKQIVEWWNDIDNAALKMYTRSMAMVIPDDVTFWDDCDVVGVTNRKLPAQLYIDDRAYRYDNQSVDQIIDKFQNMEPNRYGAGKGSL